MSLNELRNHTAHGKQNIQQHRVCFSKTGRSLSHLLCIILHNIFVLQHFFKTRTRVIQNMWHPIDWKCIPCDNTYNVQHAFKFYHGMRLSWQKIHVVFFKCSQRLYIRMCFGCVILYLQTFFTLPRIQLDKTIRDREWKLVSIYSLI